MAVILNIETSNTVCSVALTAEGMILSHRESSEGRNHAATLTGFIKDMMAFAADKGIKPEAIAVSMGPGSYTGLRIGLSEAKGLAYGLEIPMIGVSTLELMATKVMFSAESLPDDVVFAPMLDARRMEVYTAAYDLALNEIVAPRALILDEDSNPLVDVLATGRPVLFFGNGMPKWRDTDTVRQFPNALFVDGIEPMAVDMTALAERAYSNKNFLDTSYCTPTYLKDFQATKPRKKI